MSIHRFKAEGVLDGTRDIFVSAIRKGEASRPPKTPRCNIALYCARGFRGRVLCNWASMMMKGA